MTIVKTYKVNYAYGIINPIESHIEIETTNDLTEKYIIEEIERQRPLHKGQVMAVFSTILIGEKTIGSGSDEEIKVQENNDKQIPKFNW